MKKSFTIIALLISVSIFAQTHITRTLMWDETERQYLEYVPTIYNPENPAPVIFCLHGLGDNMTNFSGLGFDNIADQKGWIVITPQALDATLPMVGNIGAAWGAGVSATFPIIGYTIINPDVDDTGFLLAVLDSLENNYNINTDSVFFMGFSMGGFMANRMGIEHGDKINGIATVSGTIGNEMTSIVPNYDVNAMHIHGTNDSTITYNEGGMIVGAYGTYAVGLGAEPTVEFWRSFNNCSAEPIMSYFPNQVADGLTFERYLYLEGDNESRTAFIKVNEGEHSWYYKPANDIDYTTEIYKFLTNTMDFPSEINEIESQDEFKIYPNPSNQVLYVGFNERVDCSMKIYDITGKELKALTFNGLQTKIDLSDLSEGLYVLRVSKDGNYTDKKFVIVR
ncbi:MAG: T9SS type A sorting domain-containing protein [Bacteroidales bacterium]|nr:T9SS type A sorting domain-containing protein [Bacteroidales bacterium]